MPRSAVLPAACRFAAVGTCVSSAGSLPIAAASASIWVGSVWDNDVRFDDYSGPHIGEVVGFRSVPATALTASCRRLAQAVTGLSAGMAGGRLQVEVITGHRISVPTSAVVASCVVSTTITSTAR